MTGKPVRVLIADDQGLVRAGFRLLLDAEPDLTVIGEAADGAQAVLLTRQASPDVVLMDIRMPGVDGLEATRRIRADPALDGTRILILTTFDLDEYVFAALRAGASGYLLKGMEPEELIGAVHLIADGQALLAPTATRHLIDAYVAAAPAATTPTVALAPDMTDRETGVLALVAEGLSNVEIAERLFISPPTAKSHVSSLLAKHRLRDRVQLVVLAYESGHVHPGETTAGGATS